MRTQLHHLVAEAAVTRGDAPAVTVKDTTRTYAQLWAETEAACRADPGFEPVESWKARFGPRVDGSR